ncbi:MAG: hypothetical protein ACK5RD_20595, partial [Aphanizomenon sp.]
QTAIPTVSYAIAPLQLPPKAIAVPPTLQKRTACSSASLSHPFNSQTAISTPQNLFLPHAMSKKWYD